MLSDTGLIDRDGETFAFFMLLSPEVRRYLSGHTHILIHSYSSLSIMCRSCISFSG
jgi:hypothetical protein